MKPKVLVLSILSAVLLLVTCYEFSRAAPKSKAGGSKTGVVSIRKISRDSLRSKNYMDRAMAEEKMIVSKLQSLAKEIEANEAGLMALIVDSSDYRAAREDILMKRANLESQQSYHKQRIEMNDKRWNEELYNEIIEIIGQISKEKGLDLVLEKSEPQLPAVSASELGLIIRTHKVLYSGGCVDLTDDVIMRLDAAAAAPK